MAGPTMRMQQRRDSSDDWAAANPLLLPGELGFDTDLLLFKVGDGANPWNDLPYIDFSDAAAVIAGQALDRDTPVGAALGNFQRRWVVDVKADHDAVGDGATDDTGAFEAAIATSAATIYVPAGTYVVDGLVLDQDNQSFRLDPGATLRAKAGGTQTVLEIQGENVSVVGAPGSVIDGNDVGTDASTAVYVNQAEGATIEGLRFINCAGKGVHAEAPSPTVQNNRFVNTGSVSVMVRNYGSGAGDNFDAVVRQNHITNDSTTAYGIQVYGFDPSEQVHARVTDNHVTLPTPVTPGTGGLCIEVFGLAQESVVTSNTTRGGQFGISISGSDRVSVVGNVTRAAGCGIEVAACKGCTVTGNTVNADGVTGSVGISLDNATGDGNTVTGNTVTGTLSYGIYAVGTQFNGAIVGNSVHGPQCPIYLASVRGFTVTGNVLKAVGGNLDGVALDSCLDVVLTANVYDGFTRAGAFAFGGARTGIHSTGNILRNGTPTEFDADGTGPTKVYVDAGALKYKGSGGTVTTLGPA